MSNLLPGQGLGFTAAKEIAMGLGAVTVGSVNIPEELGGSGGGRRRITTYDNAYAARKDESEVVDLLTIFISVME